MYDVLSYIKIWLGYVQSKIPCLLKEGSTVLSSFQVLWGPIIIIIVWTVQPGNSNMLHNWFASPSYPTPDLNPSRLRAVSYKILQQTDLAIHTVAMVSIPCYSSNIFSPPIC